MDTLIVNVPGRGTRGPSLIRCTDGSLSLGRGFQNDIVLDDPFVAAEQLRFVRDDRGWTVTVLERTNPVLLNGNPLREPGARLTSGDQLTVGRTDLSVYDETHPVDPPRRLSRAGHGDPGRFGPAGPGLCLRNHGRPGTGEGTAGRLTSFHAINTPEIPDGFGAGATLT